MKPCLILPALLALALAVIIGTVHGATPEPYKPTPGPFTVATLEQDWRDATHETTVPVKLYFPKDIAQQKSPIPLIIFSHGLGGSRERYQIWADHWASHGYIVILPTHEGSDSVALTEAAKTAEKNANAAADSVINLQTALRRVQDVSFVIDQMEKANAGTLNSPALAPFKNKVDIKHIGMAGHSFGAETTLLAAGQSEKILIKIRLAEPRISAAIAMSPQPAVFLDQKTAFASIRIPVFHMTGTADDVPALGIKAAERRIPFDNTTNAPACFVNFTGASHASFSG
ncbi:MAG TPA: hypothetical protein VHM90_21355, partial [Phycisphaerae bacterium]|nr:hypothetical protein [Phycisphaerae bacterium]